MAGFMAGFGTTLANSIEEDRKYYREAAAKRRDYLQTYGTKAVVDREDKANAALGVANQLMSKGFSKDYVTNLASTNGVLGMADFAEKVLSRDDLTEDDIKDIESTAKDFIKDNPDQDLGTVINRAFGLYKSESDPVKRKTSLFGAMLGLDSRTMEDDVLNDMYVNGYTGSDIYRIMGSSGPKAGSPVKVKLPPKPLSFQAQGVFAKQIEDQFKASIAREIDELETTLNVKGIDSTVKQNTQAIRDNLVGLQNLSKSDPATAISTYLNRTSEASISYLSYLQGLEQMQAGAVSKNSLLGPSFTSTYNTRIGDLQDDATSTQDRTVVQTGGQTGDETGGQTGGQTGDETVVQTGVTATDAKTYTFNTEEEALNFLRTADPAVVGRDTIQIKGSSPRLITALPGASEGEAPAITADEIVSPTTRLRTTLKEDAIADVAAIEEAATESVNAAVDAAGTFLRGADLTLGSAVEAFQSAEAYLTAIGGAIAKRFGASKEVTDSIFERAANIKDSGTRVGDNGFFLQNAEALNEAMQDEDSFISRATDKTVELLEAAGKYIPDQPGEEAYRKAIEDAQDSTIPDTLRKAFGNLKSNVSSEDGPVGMEKVVDDFTSYLSARLERPEPDEMEARIRDDSRQFRADERSYPQPLDTIVTDLPSKIVDALSEESVREFVERGGTVTKVRDELEAGLREGARAGAERLVAYLKKLKVTDEDVLNVLNSRGLPIEGRDALQASAEAGVKSLTEKLREYKVSKADIQRVVDAFDSSVTTRRDAAEGGLRAAPKKLLDVLKDLDLSERMQREILKSGGFIIEARDAAESSIRKGLGVP